MWLAQTAILVAACIAAGCSSDPMSPRLTVADLALGSWTLIESGGGEPALASSMTITAEGFDRVTSLTSSDRLVEVAEQGSWSRVAGGHLELMPETTMLVITEPGDVSVESFESDRDSGSSARLRIVGDRLVLEMLMAGEPIARFAYSRAPEADAGT
ncbi:MAG: hypothetical protein AAGB48_05590 [Planctomycetota bacterium]